ncbi:ribose ABC transporter permease [Spirochaetia bacterium]|nr:ribose ABC transporter permease [Spirochaetia bacterium]
MENTENTLIKESGFRAGIVTGLKSNFALVIGLVVLIVIVSIRSPYFLSETNLQNILTQITTNMLLASACTIILITGGIDLSSGALIKITGVMSAAMMTIFGMPFYVAILTGLCLGLLVGAINGFILSRTTLPPFIVTFALAMICRGLANVYTNSRPIRIEDEIFRWFGKGKIGPFPIQIFILIVILGIVWLILNKSRMGRNMYAIGGNALAAEYSGINIKRIKFFMYVFSGLMSGIAGVLLAARSYAGSPLVGDNAEMDAIAATVLGGTSMLGGYGRLSGTILGVLIIGILNNGLNLMQVNSYWQLVVKGLVLMAAVYADYYKNTVAKNRKSKVEAIAKAE